MGVINLTDRIGGDRFTLDDRKLVSAVANQIGAAVENARLVERDLQQQRLQRELELAHDLQLKLLPSPAVLQGDAEVAARCLPADSVGGDFYTFSRLGRGRVGVMLGDVASHGFSAALVMALVMSAAGIHAAASITPDETLSALLDSLSTELAKTEMHFSVFYGVLDPLAGRLSYASAGHPHAFRVPADRRPRTAGGHRAPLGLATAGSIQRRQVPWSIGTTSWCSGPMGWWMRGTMPASRSASSGCWTRLRAHRTEPPEAIVRRCWRRPRSSASIRPTTARCWSFGSSGAPRQAPPGTALSHRSQACWRGSPMRSRPARTTPCWRSAPGRAGSPPRCWSGRAGWSRSRRTAT